MTQTSQIRTVEREVRGFRVHPLAGRPVRVWPTPATAKALLFEMSGSRPLCRLPSAHAPFSNAGTACFCPASPSRRAWRALQAAPPVPRLPSQPVLPIGPRESHRAQPSRPQATQTARPQKPPAEATWRPETAGGPGSLGRAPRLSPPPPRLGRCPALPAGQPGLTAGRPAGRLLAGPTPPSRLAGHQGHLTAWTPAGCRCRSSRACPPTSPETGWKTGRISRRVQFLGLSAGGRAGLLGRPQKARRRNGGGTVSQIDLGLHHDVDYCLVSWWIGLLIELVRGRADVCV